MSVPIHRLDDLAETLVFTKQSHEPLNCDPFAHPPVRVHANGTPLLPKLRGNFAEFLNEGYIERLRIFSSSTCVGLRYEYLQDSYQRLFSAVWRQPVPSLRRLRSLTPLVLADYRLGPAHPIAGRPSLLRHSDIQTPYK